MTGAVTAWPTPYRVAGDAYGVRLLVSTDSAAVLARLEELLPPSWASHDAEVVRREVAAQTERQVAAQAERETAGDAGDEMGANGGREREPAIPHFTLISHDGLEYVLRRDDLVLARCDLDVVLGVFDAQLRAYIALYSPDRVFVHAGVVGWRGRAIVIPGPSFSGKTTLVAELVRAGAVYYSDEYAVLDAHGRVHPYPKPLSIRTDGWIGVDHDVASFGGAAGQEPLPLGLVVVTQYRPDAKWDPERLSPGEAVLALLANTVPAQDRPEETMTALRSVVDTADAVTLRGDRGEAAALAPQLLEAVTL